MLGATPLPCYAVLSFNITGPVQADTGTGDRAYIL